MLFMSTIDSLKFSAGYLICVPMLDEWRTEEGIQPLDGWTFQVSHLSDTASKFKFTTLQFSSEYAAHIPLSY